ncbi:MAG: SagB/ThcOx family dehydrogenase [Cyanobacteriota bacterium]
MTIKSFAEYYHNETKYSPEGLSKNKNKIDWNRQPLPFKNYSKGKKIDLAKYISKRYKEFFPEETPEILTMKKVSELLYYTNGVTAIVPYSVPLLLRAAPSAGGLYPTEIYLVSNNYEGLENGVYNFQVKNHSLSLFWEENIWEKLKKACFDHDSFDKSNLAIIVTGVFERSEWRYQERAYRRILLDTGHIIGNITSYSPFVGKYSNLIGGFKDDEVSDLLWLDKKEEGSLAVITLSDENLKNTKTALPSSISKEIYNKNSLIRDLHDFSKILIEKPVINREKEAVAKLSFTFGEKIEYETIDWENKFKETILLRRSTRAYDNEEKVLKEDVLKILSFAYKPDDYKSQGFDPDLNFFDLSLIETYIAITNVEGIDDGCYHFSPEKQELKQIRFKNFSKEIHYLCLGQELGKDAGLVIFHTVDLQKAVEKYGERAYRYLHLDSGNLGQRLNLACIKIGLGVSGIGGFFDEQVNDLLGIPESQAVLYVTTIGKPLS